MAAIVDGSAGELFPTACAGDPFDHGYGELADDLGASALAPPIDRIVANPPLKCAPGEAGVGAAMPLRTAAPVGGARQHDLFGRRPRTIAVQFPERAPGPAPLPE